LSEKVSHGKIWNFKYTKHVLFLYLIFSISLFLLEFFLTNQVGWSFFITYAGIFYIAPYTKHGIEDLFDQFHIKNKFRNVLVPWILFFLIFVYCALFFISGLIPFTIYAIYITAIVIVFNILLTINSLIRIVAVGFHRRKIDIFPINRVEFAAMEHLKNGNLSFYELKNKIKGIFNIFIQNVYFDDETAASSIYLLCGLRLADSNEKNVSLNEKGKKSVKIWEDTLKNQLERFNKILNSNAVLIRSFIGLFLISLFKIFFGFFNSDSLFAEGFENFLDCVAVILIGIGIKFKKEKFVNIILVSLMTFTGISILISSIGSLFNPEPISASIIIIIISIISIFFNTYLRTLKNFVGKKNRNSSLVASAIDSRVNIMISIGIIVGTLFSDLGANLDPPFTLFYYLDPIIAIIVCFLIFKEVVEIIKEFITGEEEEIEFESFQMKYEEIFEEYIIKWILSVYNDDPEIKLTTNQLNEYFQKSLKKGEEIYTEFSHFGLYLFKEKGIHFIITKLIKNDLLNQTVENYLTLTEKGVFLYENFYSGELLEDVQDPFDFFFDDHSDTAKVKYRKKKVLENFETVKKGKK